MGQEQSVKHLTYPSPSKHLTKVSVDEMTITIVYPGGKSFQRTTISVPCAATVGMVKQTFARTFFASRQLDCPVEALSLSFKNRPWSNEATVWEAGICEGSEVRIMFRLTCGGKYCPNHRAKEMN